MSNLHILPVRIVADTEPEFWPQVERIWADALEEKEQELQRARYTLEMSSRAIAGLRELRAAERDHWQKREHELLNERAGLWCAVALLVTLLVVVGIGIAVWVGRG
jgi:hypothetical protein